MSRLKKAFELLVCTVLALAGPALVAAIYFIPKLLEQR